VIEQPEDMAQRKNCTYLKANSISASEFDRHEMCLIDMFEFMIGNTDWSVTEQHNILVLSYNPFEKPYAVPYDFDWSGLVNAPYAVPFPDLGLTSVTERLYMGYCRTPEEFEKVISVFNNKKQQLFDLVNTFNLLPEKERKKMCSYLDEFYKMINQKNAASKIFNNLCKEKRGSE
jgi:hypothetical protein